MTTMEDVAAFIGGATKPQIDTIYGLCRDRHKTINRVQASVMSELLEPGDKVRITGGISPKYLVGVTATVAAGAGAKPGSVRITLDRSVGKYASGYPIGIPASCLEKVES